MQNESASPSSALLNVNGPIVFPLPVAGGTVPSYPWHRGRTALPRKRPVSYERRNKRKGTDSDAAPKPQTRTNHTNKCIANANILSPYFMSVLSILGGWGGGVTQG